MGSPRRKLGARTRLGAPIGRGPGLRIQAVQRHGIQRAQRASRVFLAQSGFDVVRLTVELHHKFTYPLMGFVIALIGVPFAFTTGSRGALTGIAASLGIAIVYWATSSLFEAMGNLGQLPPAVAAWSPDVLFGLGGIWLLMRVKT
ncbi:MAG: hypothetical protein DMG21_09440 [Acidobacteria bacterium]|nr:MAG: hypothetical protein DMG21_09440 [Acidobacteriota bacterium]